MSDKVLVVHVNCWLLPDNEKSLPVKIELMPHKVGPTLKWNLGFGKLLMTLLLNSIELLQISFLGCIGRLNMIFGYLWNLL